MALIDFVAYTKEQRFLSEVGDAQPKNEETVGNYASYKILPAATQGVQSVRDTPFQMGGARNSAYGSLDVGIDAVHSSLTNYNTELYHHNLNGFLAAKNIHEQLSTSASLKAYNNERHFIMSDNTFPGSGKFTGSWLSNFHRTWTDMRNSIAGVLNLNMFGVLTAGTEVCGSLGAFNSELCGRWTQNAVLLPAVRNYYNATFYNEATTKWETNPKGELFNIDPTTDYQWEISANGAIKQRYKLMQYMYTEMFKASKAGKPYVRPVFFDEPQTATLYADPVEDSYMAGDALHVSTVLAAGSQPTTSKFAQGKWVLLSDFTNQEIVVKENGNNVPITPMIGDATIHLKAGKAIPYQKNVIDVKSTKQLLERPTEFLIYRDDQQYAEGHIFLDDGHSVLTDDNHSLWKLRHAAQTITFFLESGSSAYVAGKNAEIQSIRILMAADLANMDFACAINANNEATNLLAIYNTGNSVFEIKQEGDKFFQPREIKKIVYGNSKTDINLCTMDKSFKYKVVGPPAPVAPAQSVTYQIQNKEVDTQKLYVTFSLLDDAGTVKITYSRTQNLANDPTADMVDEVTNFKWTKANINNFVTVRSDPFQFNVYDSNKNELFSGDALMFFDPESKYIMTHSMIPLYKMAELPIYGLGGRKGSVQWPKTESTTITLWNSHTNSQHYQPFYIYRNVGGSWCGVFDLSTNAMDYNIQTNREDQNVIISHVTTSQYLKKYIFTAPTPNQVIATY